MWIKSFGWLLGLENLVSVDQVEPALAAPWVQGEAFWVLLAAAGLGVLALAYYLKTQRRGPAWARLGLGFSRGALLALLLVTLADPVLRLSITNRPPPLVYVVLDGTESMAIEDKLSESERTQLDQAVGLAGETQESTRRRVDYVEALLRQPDPSRNVLERLARERGCQLEAFVLEGLSHGRLRRLSSSHRAGQRMSPAEVADQLTSDGQLTAIGSALQELRQQYGSSQLAGVVLVSDFVQNAGVPPLGSGPDQPWAPATQLGVPIYTVGVGATAAKDLAVEVQPPPKMKRAERSSIRVKVTQTALEGQPATVRVVARPLELQRSSLGQASEILVGEKTVDLAQPVEYLDFPYTPEDAGRFQFEARAEPLDGETLEDNNVSARETNIIDDFLRLMFVADEPTWEWRFVKEVFHRDKLVGMRGFRTYLRSSDPIVRQKNELFLPSLTPSRADFFATDVIFLGEMPAEALSQRFCELTREFVSRFGGGLVVIAGPRHGPGPLADTPLADMLPVIVDPAGGMRDEQEFRLQLTPEGWQTDFMQLGTEGGDTEHARAWENLGPLPWYQPVRRLHPLATALAVHPQDRCTDGQAPQPLIAIRRYGRGEVVYLGFHEMWRLRRKYGELYYRQFWSQLINRLGLSHALGSQKRFVVRTDRPQYQADQQVVLSVEAYDASFEPLRPDQLDGGQLAAELQAPGAGGGPPVTRRITLSELREGEFEARFPVLTAGPYSVQLRDPVTGASHEVRFEVADLSVERRSSERDVNLQEALAQATGGRSYDLQSVVRLPDELQLEPRVERLDRQQPLWTTPLWFLAVVGLMLGEWLARKMLTLT